MRTPIMVTALAVVRSSAFAQEPPMKMGLWESTVEINMQLPPGMPSFMGKTKTVTTQSCLTPESWQKTMERANNPRGDCTYQDKTVTATGYTFTMTCSSRSTSTTIKGSATYESPEKGSTVVHMEMSGMGGGNLVSDSKGTTRYLGADCGKVKPYTGK